MGALLIRLTNERDDYQQHGGIAERFGRLQWESIAQLLFTLVLFVALATALGIGAWNTHYQAAVLEQNIAQHFELATSSLAALTHSNGDQGTLVSTVFLTGLALTGFAFLVTCSRRLGLDWSSPTATQRRGSVAQTLLAFGGAAWFIKHGINTDLWVILGVLAWLLLCHHLIGACRAVSNLQSSSQFGAFATAATIGVVALGLIQCILLAVHFGLSEQWITATVIALLFAVALTGWWRDVITLIQTLRQNATTDTL